MKPLRAIAALIAVPVAITAGGLAASLLDGFPRTRGDEPTAVEFVPFSDWFSPHTRG